MSFKDCNSSVSNYAITEKIKFSLSLQRGVKQVQSFEASVVGIHSLDHLVGHFIYGKEHEVDV